MGDDNDNTSPEEEVAATNPMTLDEPSSAETTSAATATTLLDLPDPDDDDYPDWTLNSSHAAATATTTTTTTTSDPTVFTKPARKEGLELHGPSSSEEASYILGTLVVRVVAARDLEPVPKGGGFGSMVLGKSNGTANPYASVKFGTSTQRTSEVFDTLNPIWPRQETMFMDVSLPTSQVTHAPSSSQPSSSSKQQQSSSASASTANTSSSSSLVYEKPPTILTVALFHTQEVGRVNKYPTKGGGILSGDSDDLFLGMASVDLTKLFTGQEHTLDQWLKLSGTSQTCRSTVRIVCEYESSETPPRPGDDCRFTRYCHPRDLYPLECGRRYRVSEVVDGDILLISYQTPEGWVCTFQAHRYMVICEERHLNAAEMAQDELVSLAERLSHSPLVHSIAEGAERVAVDGLLHVGEEVVHGGWALLQRWCTGGVDTIVRDVTQATNLDGRYNPDNGERLNIPDVVDNDDDDHVNSSYAAAASSSTSDADDDDDPKKKKALPNMPCCPITGEPMIDPVVAADGHTYERTAIARWFTTSNKSPMTGGVLGHKELVPNYGLMTSVQEAAAAAASSSKEPQQQSSSSLSPVAAKGTSDSGDDVLDDDNVSDQKDESSVRLV